MNLTVEYPWRPQLYESKNETKLLIIAIWSVESYYQVLFWTGHEGSHSDLAQKVDSNFVSRMSRLILPND